MTMLVIATLGGSSVDGSAGSPAQKLARQQLLFTRLQINPGCIGPPAAAARTKN
jgi:hypothetical protein